MQPANIGLFIEPEGSLRAAIEADKKQVSAVCDEAPYLHHPPHMTLLAGCYADPEVWLPALQHRVSTTCVPFELETEGYFVFSNDALVGSGDTLVFRVKENARLRELQQDLAEVVGPHCLIPHEDRSAGEGLLAQAPFRSSWLHYGFPFVGDHWIPHFTVANIPPSAGTQIVETISSQDGAHRMTVQQISVWTISGEHHRCYRPVPFPETAG